MRLARLQGGICPGRFVIPARLMEPGLLLRFVGAYRVLEGTLPCVSPRLHRHRGACCHTPGEGMGTGMRNKGRNGPTAAGGSFSKLWLMGTLFW